ncbi:pirin family protein [Aerophototrophica crusticola]|uniref:Pirin family protein n=1 Tax=Aerophototrophica crusticola TaxID=1709002 RepID=A0A858R6Y1_9PROT|nr:pirin family protein [Rhodospirillaceae bacterium B3]
MIERRSLSSLGNANFGWLDAKHHFSFGHYHDPKRVHWGPLRVWNDDTIAAGTGFDPHPHRDMEIITYVRKGAITHQDRLGNQGRTEAGDVQVMSAGTGIVHAEYNREPGETQIFQIWIIPNKAGVQPRWEARQFPKGESAGKLVTLASGRAQDKDSQALMIHQDAALLGATLPAGTTVTHELGDRLAYLVPARGKVRVNGVEIDARDGAAIRGEPTLTIEALEEAEILLADLPQAA